MRLIIWHCKQLSYQDVRPSTKPDRLKNMGDLRKGQTKREKTTANFENVLAVFTCIEAGDDAINIKKAVELVQEMLKMLKIEKKVVIVPFAHLSPRLAPPTYAIARINELEKALASKKIETNKTSFGFHKDFKFHGYGHPGSVAYRDIPSPEPVLSGYFDREEAMSTGIFISGSPKSGKSNLAFWIADALIKQGIIVYVFDPSQIWARESAIPKIIMVDKDILKTAFIELPRESTIFDISLLHPSKQIEFVENFSGALFNERAMRARAKTHRPHTVLFFEEAQMYIPTGKLRVGEEEEIMRIISVGRNLNIRYCLLTQLPSMVDKMPMKMCRQRYFGYTSEREEIEYLRGQIGNQADKLKKLLTGQFLYQHNNEIKLFKVPRFEK